MFAPTDFLFGKRIGLVSVDHLSIIFTYYTLDNQQECSEAEQLTLLAVLGPWMNTCLQCNGPILSLCF